MAVAAQLSWAQRFDTVFLRVNLQDAENVKVEMTETGLSFTARVEKKEYENKIDFFKNIDTEKSGYQQKGRTIDCLIYKQDTSDGSYWPRLTKVKGKIHWLSIDFGRWRDEDDSEGEEDFNQDFDFNKLVNNKGGMNYSEEGFDPENINMDDIDSDDDDMPDLKDLDSKDEKEAPEPETQMAESEKQGDTVEAEKQGDTVEAEKQGDAVEAEKQGDT